MRLVSLLLATTLLIAAAVQAADVVPADGVTPTQCGPGPAGSPCGGDGPASQGNSSDTNQGAGNPINVITGNKYQQETDLPALPGVLGLEIVRHYNSSQSDPRTPPGILGRGWRLSYETDLYPIGNTLQIVQADGTRIIFVRDPRNPSACASNNPANGRLAITRTPRGEEYTWTWTNGRTLSFNHQGKLTEIRAPSGEFVSLTRDTAGVLVKVTDPQGRSLTLGYPQRKHPDRFNGVVAIDSPVGRFTYEYGSAAPKVRVAGAGQASPGNPRDLLANLVSVDLPGGIRRQYHFDDPAHPTLLTGISVAGKDGKPQRISTYAYDDQGRGILSVKGEPKRLGQDGKPVAGTGIEQVNLAFAPGKTTLTNSLGQKTTYTHAIVGNEYRLVEVRGAGCASCGEANVRYGYDGLGRLTTVTKLSADGQPLATTKTERDTQGRPVRISRIDYRDGKAQPAKLIARYEYEGDSPRPILIARPSVVAGKEHQVRIAYNAHGQPLAVTESGFSPAIPALTPSPSPGGRGEEVAALITRTTTYVYRTINNRSLLVSVDGPLPNGKTNSPADSDVTRVEYDQRGTALAVVSPGGFKSAVRYDEAGRIAMVGQTPWPSPPVQAHATQAARSVVPAIAFDGLARPVAWQGGGQTLLKASWGEAGTAAQFRMLALASGNSEARRLVDDFGRVVAIRNPGMGWQTAAYDVASRLVRIVDPRGAVQVAHYDFASRLLRLARYPAAHAAPEETLTLRWQGRLKTEAAVADAEGTRRTLWRHDAEGRLVEETQEIALKGAVPVRFAVRRNLDDAGERIELADASGTHSILVQSRDAQGRVEAMRLAGWLPDWLGGGRALVKEIGWTQVEGLAFANQIVYGDGRIDRWPLERPGTAARTVALAQDTVHPVNGLERPGEDHDAAGLPAVLDTEAGRLKLAWDAAGRLATISQGDQNERFIYDAQGRRVAKRIGQHIRYFAYDGIQLAGEADATGRLLTRYAYLGYRPIAQIVAPQGAWQRFMAWLIGPQARTYATSKTGRVLAMHDSGRVVWQDTETASVRRVSLVKPLHQPLRDVGQYADEESGLIYHMARFFDARSGLFLSPDPKGIADVVEHTRPDLLLNPYAYAGGYPDEFFDPDGAAKIRYFLIDTSLGQGNQITGRWSFYIYDIGGASGQTRFLYDGGGSFIGSASNPLGGSGNYLSWLQSDVALIGRDPIKEFANYYAYDLVSPTTFISDISDEHARRIIADITHYGDVYSKYWCSSGQHKLMYPSVIYRGITYWPGGKNGENDASPGTLVAQGSESAQCTQLLTPRYRFEIVRQATIDQESGVRCTDVACSGQINNGTGWTGGGITANYAGPAWPASWGRTQFTTATFLENVIRLAEDPDLARLNNGQRPFRDTAVQNIRGSLTPVLRDPTLPQAQQLAALGIDNAALLQAFYTQYGRAEQVRAYWNVVVQNVRQFNDAYAPDYASWRRDTGLSNADFDQLINWRRYRLATPGPQKDNYRTLIGLSLVRGQEPNGMTDEETLQAFQTKAIMADTHVRQALMGILFDAGRFNALSDYVIWREITRLPTQYPTQDERQLAASFAYYHNSGNRRITPPGPGYVNQYLSHWDARCTVTATVDRFRLDPIKNIP